MFCSSNPATRCASVLSVPAVFIRLRLYLRPCPALRFCPPFFFVWFPMFCIFCSSPPVLSSLPLPAPGLPWLRFRVCLLLMCSRVPSRYVSPSPPRPTLNGVGLPPLVLSPWPLVRFRLRLQFSPPPPSALPALFAFSCSSPGSILLVGLTVPCLVCASCRVLATRCPLCGDIFAIHGGYILWSPATSNSRLLAPCGPCPTILPTAVHPYFRSFPRPVLFFYPSRGVCLWVARGCPCACSPLCALLGGAAFHPHPRLAVLL